MTNVLKSLSEVIASMPNSQDKEAWKKVMVVYRSENRSIVQPIESKMERLLKGSLLKERDEAVSVLVPLSDCNGIELRHICSRIARMAVCQDSLTDEESRLIAAPFEAVGVSVVDILNKNKQ